MPTEAAGERTDDWEVDVLGEPYRALTFELRPDSEGPVVATLVHRPAADPTGRAVLHVHGFADYFFQTVAADHWVERGYDFYALDLRKYGRSIRAHQTPNYVADLTSYYEELDLAWQTVSARHEHVVLSGHSTGGLTAPLWIHDRGLAPAGLVLNSPWLAMQGDPVTRNVLLPVVGALGRRQPMRVVPRKVSGFYARSLHVDHEGEWPFDLDLKPLASFPVYAGWLRAIRAGHARIAAGLDIAAPILVLTSARSGHASSIDDPDLTSTDIVLDVEQIRRRAPLLGHHVTQVMIEGAIHDVTLSAAPIRKQVFDEVDRFLGAYVDEATPAG